MKMFVILSLILTRFFSPIAAHPQITTAPELVVRQAGNDICGYYFLDGATYSITCEDGLACAVATTTRPAVKYCPGTGVWSDTPVTTQFGYGNWPVDGCVPGQGCCPESEPSAGIYSFDDGSTVLLGCGLSAFTYTAFEIDSASPSSVTTPTSTTFELNSATTSSETTPTSKTLVVGAAGSSSRPTGSAATSPAGSTSSTTTSSSGKTAVEIVVIVVLGVVSVTFFAIFLHFLKQCYKMRQQPNYAPVAQTSPGLYSTPQPEKGLSRWSKVAGIVSPCIALPSLGLALFVAFR
ncbi:hypothetical protein JMJ35_006425 [Cladonia borealis]|uniref:Uncharacterized protein n=1 Tax=Cladonia borealis TaxID=184061 RepID=A0AA39QX77_9LECA|nr:hypothetical protein JMJ35_006425 [Cladonia borealis]